MRCVRLAVGAGITLAVGFGAVSQAAPPPDRLPPTRPTVDGDIRPDTLRPVFTFGATDRRTPRSGIRFRCAFDRATLRPCARIHRPAAALAFGPHELRAQAVDRAGNASRITRFTFSVVGSWDAARDFERAPRPANPGRDRYGNTTWFYLSSTTPAHDPAGYRPQPFFAVLAPNWEVWRSEDTGLSGSQTGYNNGSILMHPGHFNLGQNAVLGWRSPLAATVELSGSISTNAASLCGVTPNGVVWSIDHGAATLRSGSLAAGQRTDLALTVTVAAGESLYVVVNDAGDSNCDSTFVDLTIETT